MKRVFLGGTCNDSTWRGYLIPILEKEGIPYFNPVVEDWTPECQAKEDEVKADPETVCLFVITCEMKGAFSVAEVVDMSNKAPGRIVFLLEEDGFDSPQLKSLQAVRKMVRSNGAAVVGSYRSVVDFLKKKIEKVYP